MQHLPPSSVHTVPISLTHTPLAQEETNMHQENTKSHAQNTHDRAAIRLLPLERYIKATSQKTAEESKQACVNARYKCQLPCCCCSFSMTYLTEEVSHKQTETTYFSANYIHIYSSLFFMVSSALHFIFHLVIWTSDGCYSL